MLYSINVKDWYGTVMYIKSLLKLQITTILPISNHLSTVADADEISTNTVNANFRNVRTIIYINQVPTIVIQLLLLRLIRTPDEAIEFSSSFGVRINEIHCILNPTE